MGKQPAEFRACGLGIRDSGGDAEGWELKVLGFRV